MTEQFQKLLQETRKYKISQIKPGDLIKLKSDVLSFIYHYGIVVEETDGMYVYHNTPDFINRKGGSIVRESLNDWLKHRDILSIEPTGLTTEEIDSIVKKVYDKKYDFLHFNCEHFTNYVKSKRPISPQVAQWSIVVAAVAITYLVYRKIRK